MDTQEMFDAASYEMAKGVWHSSMGGSMDPWYSTGVVHYARGVADMLSLLTGEDAEPIKERLMEATKVKREKIDAHYWETKEMPK